MRVFFSFLGFRVTRVATASERTSERERDSTWWRASWEREDFFSSSSITWGRRWENGNNNTNNNNNNDNNNGGRTDGRKKEAVDCDRPRPSQTSDYSFRDSFTRPNYLLYSNKKNKTGFFCAPKHNEEEGKKTNVHKRSKKKKGPGPNYFIEYLNVLT